MFFIFRFILVWSIWLIFADRRRWREIFPVCIFASFLGLGTDLLNVFFPYWHYFHEDFHPLIIAYLDEFGIYPVTVYLFIQWLPNKQTVRNMVVYWFLWTGIALAIEVIHLTFGYMEHYNGWTLGYSYIANWFLYYLFYKFHKVFNLRLLSSP